MRGKINNIKQKLASYIYIYIYRAAQSRLSLRPGTSLVSHYIKSSRNLRIAGTIASVLLLTISALTIYPVAHKSNLAEAATGTASSTSLTITSDHPAANLDLVVRGSGGTFAESTSSEQASFGVATNNYTGYTLSIAGSDSTGQLTNTTTGSTFDSIEYYTDADTFTNGSDALYNGKWGYKPSMYNSTTNTYFRPAPTTSGSTLNITGSANTKKSTASGDTVNCDNYNCNEYTIALGARADITTKAGIYTNTFILTAVGRPVPYTISYHDNSGDSTVSGMPATSTVGSTDGTSITLSDAVPSRKFYTFAGWCGTETTVLDNGSTSCSGTTYSAGGAFGLDQTTDNTVSLYAVWNYVGYTITFATSNASGIYFNGTKYSNGDSVVVESGTYQIYGDYPTKTAFKSWSVSSGTLGDSNNQLTTFTPSDDATITLTGQAVTVSIQNLSEATCTSVPTPVYDTRDNEVYWIAKLADNKCWMLDNMRLGSDSTVDLTSSDTNIASNWTLPASGTVCFTSSSCTGTDGTTTGTGYTVPAINSDSKGTINSNSSRNLGNGSHKYGVYYNYCAASAGTYCYASGSGTGNASYDICPKGWRMPTGGDSGEYQALYTAYSSNATDFRNALSATMSGYFDYGSASGQGYSGRFWSSTIYGDSGSMMYGLNFDTYTVYPLRNNNRINGIPVRCLLDTRTPFEKLQAGSLSMQDIGNLSISEKNTLVSQMADSTVYHATDSRDNQVYDVAKLNGQLWMAENLNLTTPTVDLTSANTNLSTTVTQATFTGWQKTSGSGTYTAGEFIPVSGTDSTSQTPYGTLYNYCAASAGTYCYSLSETIPDSATYDICPKGWRLPTSGDSGEFQALYNNSSYNSNAKMRAPISQGGAAFALPGSFYNSRPGSQGSYGYYWSSTRNNNAYMYSLWLSTSSVNPAYYSSTRYYGYSIRCVLDTRTISDVANMQDVTPTVAANTTEDTVATLADSRDNQTYTVGKLKDGNIWMLQNLKLGKNTTTLNLTTADSDVPSGGFTLTNKSSNGKFTNAGNYNNDNSQYYCTDAYGCYYNWYTATASSGSSATTSGSVDYSICPKGWTLPTGGSGEFKTLTNLYGGTGTTGATAMLVTNPTTTTENTSGLATPGLLLGGYYYSSGASNIGSSGSYWSRTASSAQSGYYLYISSTNVSPASNNSKYYGRSVRCLAK